MNVFEKRTDPMPKLNCMANEGMQKFCSMMPVTWGPSLACPRCKTIASDFHASAQPHGPSNQLGDCHAIVPLQNCQQLFHCEAPLVLLEEHFAVKGFHPCGQD